MAREKRQALVCSHAESTFKHTYNMKTNKWVRGRARRPTGMRVRATATYDDTRT